jgi:cobalamin-dependent methionine synthase I
MVKALAECMHERVRREFWAYAPDEALTSEERLTEVYRGIRPEAGLSGAALTPRRRRYSACSNRSGGLV